MKRHPALQDLSRDHFTALLRCLEVRRVARNEPFAAPFEEVAETFVDLVTGELPLHCEEEDRLLLPLLEAHGGEALAARLRGEHEELRARLGEVADRHDAGELDPEGLHAAAEALRRHARWEENELFPWLQAQVPEKGLRRLGEDSRLFRLRHRGPGAVGPS